ncbi:MAG TPA: ATP-dependent DNA helicase RecG [Verrucomicrobiae bacterium]|nr:ATP-dependent DNA helicase RecG [Verrucomicrobiae bacterium]
MTVASSTVSPLKRPVTSLFGVGPERAGQLARLEVRTIEDLLLHRPLRYEDRQHLRRIAELEKGSPAITHGKIVAMGTKWYKQHSKSIFEIILDDGSARLHCRWWNLLYMEKYFKPGDEVLVFGRPVSLKPRTIDHAETEVLEGGEESFIHLNRITPVYPLTEGLPQRWLRAMVWRTLQAFETRIDEPWPQLNLAAPAKAASSAPDPRARMLAANSAAIMSFPSRARAIRMLHFPEAPGEPEIARRRLALDEFIELQRRIQLRRRNFEANAQSLPCSGDNHLIKPFLARLGFTLTASQTKVLRELRKDMSGAHPMRRLLQGDVGSGKTVVAACCALMALESGYSAALMAPTEILAEQHFLTFSDWLRPLGVRVGLRTASRKTEALAPAREAANPNAKSSTPLSLTIGTHALIQPGFMAENLGLVIIDEQHRFGVVQREEFVRKGRYPHLLVMTATPIPRTLGLTLYGDLDSSRIDELPPGRGRIKTFVRGADTLPKVWDFVRGKLAEGRQAYVICPRVEDGGVNEVKAVTKEFDALRQRLAPFHLGLLHGRLATGEKEDVMRRFRANQVQALLATTLIEVGVDVPNATLMVIENAEQFGLAQLHQLRGRIGRGTHDSFCVLVARAGSKESRRRLRVLEATTDGFEIAEADLKLRGPGELLGQEQSGAPRFRFGNLAEDLRLIEQARQLATETIETEGR